VGLDGEKKMSKSMDNYIAFNDSPKDMFGKIMSIGDEVMWTYYRLLLCKPTAEVEALKAQHPMAMKKALARTLVDKLHGAGAGQAELEQFEKVFSRQEIPDTMPEFDWAKLGGELDSARLSDVMGNTGLFPSKKECRRLIEQKAVKIDGQVVADPNHTMPRPASPAVVQAGKRIFFRVLA
jgi:tyrosyl-tRNA synthetase